MTKKCFFLCFFKTFAQYDIEIETHGSSSCHEMYPPGYHHCFSVVNQLEHSRNLEIFFDIVKLIPFSISTDYFS